VQDAAAVGPTIEY